MKALIFGCNGQDGYYLSELLKQHKYEIAGVSRMGNQIIADVGNFEQTSLLIKTHQPDYIFHLAANSTTRHDSLFENHETIATGTLNILESVKNFSAHSRVFISGSGLQFKNRGKPIKEGDEFEARDVYSVSRIQSVYAARYFRSLGIKAYVGYFFNHDSPLRTKNHMSQKIVTALKNIINGSSEKIEIGDISVKKEWGFAGDTVKAIWTQVNQDEVFEAVIGTGKAYSIEDWLTICFKSKNLDWHNYVVKNEEYVSPYKILVSDPSTVFSLGWKHETSIEQLALMMINYRNDVW